MRGDYIDTFSGNQFWFLEMNESMICIEDIAHHLALINRFTGALDVPYSVAQHSVIGSYIPEELELQYAFLLHDSHEAYFGDLSRPLKRSMPPAVLEWWNQRVNLCQSLIHKKFRVTVPDEHIIKWADTTMLLTEKRDMLPRAEAWRYDRAEPLERKIIPWTWEEAEQRFLLRYNILRTALENSHADSH